MPFESWVLLAVVAANIALFGLLLSRRKLTKTNTFFALAIFFNILWAIGDFLLLTSSDTALARTGASLFFAAPVMTAHFLLFFSLNFPQKASISKIRTFFIGFPAALIAAISLLVPGVLFTNLVVDQRLNSFEVTVLPFVIYALYLFVSFVASYFIIFSRMKKTRGVVRMQLRYIFVAAVLSSSFAMVTNVMLPLQGDTSKIWLGPVFTLIYVVIVTLAIAKYRLFSIRLIAVRSLAFLLSAAVASFIYFAIVFLASTIFISETKINSSQTILYLFASFFVAVTFRIFLNYFERITEKIFYRGHYNVQDVLGKIGHILETEIILDRLAKHSITEICKNLFIESGKIVLVQDGEIYKEWVYGESIGFLDARQVKHLSHGMLVADELHSGLRLEIMETHNIRLSMFLQTKEEFEAYILLGDKLNGDIYTDDDVRLLEIIARDISVSIQNAKAYEKIALFNETLQTRIKEATNELQRSNLKLKSIDESKDDFISMASHQLRTPLTSVKGFLSMVLEGDAGEINDAQRQMLQQAFISSQRMTFLIADLLNLSRLKTGKFLIDRQPTNLANVVSQEVSQLAETAKSRSLTLTYDFPKTFPTVLLDETKTRQVIMNFIDNAIYYTPHGGEIVVALKETESSVEFTVKDTGIGVAKSEQPKLFTKFYRADNAKRARPDGTGLGLFMAKKVIIAQGGSIIFKSEESKGSTFGFALPKKTQ